MLPREFSSLLRTHSGGCVSNRGSYVRSLMRKIALAGVLTLGLIDVASAQTATNSATVTPPGTVTNPGTSCVAPNNFNSTTGACTATDSDTITSPSVSIAVAPASVAEDGSGNLVYTVTLSQVLAVPLTVNLTSSGTATSGTDYTGAVTSVTIPAGSTTATFNIDPTVDTVDEPDETVIYTIATGTGYAVGTPGSATGTITDDDATPTLTVGNATAAEGSNLVHTVTLSNASSSATTYPFVLADGTAVAPGDYTNTPTFSNGVTLAGGVLTVPAGVTTFTVTYPSVQDTIDEPNETTTLTIGGVSGTGTITDVAPVLSVAIGDAAAVNEGQNLVYTVTLTGGTSTTDITIPLTYGCLLYTSDAADE